MEGTRASRGGAVYAAKARRNSIDSAHGRDTLSTSQVITPSSHFFLFLSFGVERTPLSSGSDKRLTLSFRSFSLDMRVAISIEEFDDFPHGRIKGKDHCMDRLPRLRAQSKTRAGGRLAV